MATDQDAGSAVTNLRGKFVLLTTLTALAASHRSKSFFLQVIDPLFSKNEAGAELPISISGTQANPVFAVMVLYKKIEWPLGKPGMP